ncbi:MAG: homoserine O-succinyltransferase [Desulfovibrio sp.]|nr:homoserine O-succinyltransferase [Desulfovibrio sp.]
MPIKIPRDLPARKALEDENIFVMTEERANQQDIRPLEIAIVNLMPLKLDTEIQLMRVLGNSPIQVNITLAHTATHESRHTSKRHLERFYKTFDQICDNTYDGMILTGAPVEQLPFEEVDYWEELSLFMDFAQKRVFSTLYLCWAAQAALYHFYGIPKYQLPAKISGIFSHKALVPNSPLMRGFYDQFLAPHSRHTEIRAEDCARVGDLRLLASSPEAGLALLESRDRRQVFMTGHLEYERDTLNREFQRDARKGLRPQKPRHYYPLDDPQNEPLMLWRAHAHLFFNNWLNYYVYQETPFRLNAISALSSNKQGS